MDVRDRVLSSNRVFSRVPHPLRGFSDETFARFLDGGICPPQSKLPAVSTFSGAGIGDFGYRLAGFSFKVQAELMGPRLEIARRNHPRAIAVQGDLRETWGHVVDSYRSLEGGKTPALLTGMTPCQGMSPSTHYKREGRNRRLSRDRRNTLPFVLVDIARELRPYVIVVENVAGIVSTRVRDPETGVVGTIAALLAGMLCSYACYPVTVQFADYGVPQRRQRTLLTFLRKDLPAVGKLKAVGRSPYPTKTHDRFARHGMLPWVTAADFLGPPRFRPLSSSSPGRASDPADPMHLVPVYSPERFQLIRDIPPMSGQSAYENDGCVSCGMREVPSGLASCPNCDAPMFSRPIVVTSRGPRLILGHKTSYQRMPADMPIATITTATGHLGSDTKIHPWENRLLSPRECAEAQSVPVSFSFKPTAVDFEPTLNRQVIGEAIPPWFTFLHGLALRNLLGGGQAIPFLLPVDDYDIEDLSIDSIDLREASRRRKRARYHSAHREKSYKSLTMTVRPSLPMASARGSSRTSDWGLPLAPSY